MECLNKIYAGDCLELMKSLPSGSIDLIIADPPYYRTNGKFDYVFKSEHDYIEWMHRWVGEAYRVLKETGAFYCWGSDKMIDKVSVLVLDNFDWIKRNLIVWNYQTGRPSKAAYRNETEFMWFYSKKDHRLNIDDIRIPYTNGVGHEKDKRKNPLGKSCGNVWINTRIKPNYAEWVAHPTQKPLAICDRIILASSKENDVVLIPFAGSGSEAVSCIRHRRNFIAAEIEPQYVEICRRRIDEEINRLNT